MLFAEMRHKTLVAFKARPMSAVVETRILTWILGALATEADCALIMPDGSMRGSPTPKAVFWRMNTGKARDKTGRSVAFGVPGQADITGAVRGHRMEIEVKTDDGAQSPAQRTFQSRCESAGAIYIVARCPDDVMPRVRELLSAQ